MYASVERINSPHHFFATHLSKIKIHGFAKSLKIMLRIIRKRLLSLISDDCWGNVIELVFQMAILETKYYPLS